MTKEIIRNKIFELFEQGVAMLSSVLKSEKAIQVNIAIMRAFEFIRQYALNHQDLTERLKKIEKRCNKKFQNICDAINNIITVLQNSEQIRLF